MLGKYGSGGGCVSMAFGTNVGSFGYPGGTLYTAGTVGPWCGAIVPGTAFCGMPVFEITTPHSCFSRGATTGEGASGMMSWNLHCGALRHCEPTSNIQPHSWHEQTTEPCHKALVTNNLPLSFCTYHILWHELHLPHSLAQTLARTFASHAPTTFLSQLHQPHSWHELKKTAVRTGTTAPTTFFGTHLMHLVTNSKKQP